MDLKDIKAIIDLMKKYSIAEFELERQDFKIKLKRGIGGPAMPDELLSPAGAVPYLVSSPPVSVSPTVTPVSPGTPAPPSATTEDAEVTSPMIGTFYTAPSPESASYVEVGSEVNPDTVVCIIEAMKVMNEIKAEVKGVVTEILVESAKPVEFGQPLFRIRTS
jgi:acetyl-CoA carboxylase biotin carboxyl carrier protein